MPDRSRVNGWLRHQLIYKVVTPTVGDEPWARYVVFSLVIVPGLYGSRVTVYRNGERVGRSIRLGGQNAVDTATEAIARSLGIAGIELMDKDGTLHHVVDTPNTPWGAGISTVTLIARV